MTSTPEKKIRVGVVIPFYYPVFGGAENQCRALLKVLTAGGGVEFPFIMTRRKSADLAPEACVDGVRVLRIDPPGMSRWAHYMFYLRLLCRLLRHGRRVDLIHCHATSVTGFCVALAGRALGKPVILKLSTNGELLPKEDRVGRGLLKRMLAGYLGRRTAMVALNQEGVAELKRCNSSFFRLIPNGVDSGRFRPPTKEEREDLRQQFGLADEEIVFLFSGRFVQRKGIDLLCAAFAELTVDPCFANARLCLLGSGEGQAESVASLVKSTAGAKVRCFAAEDVVRFLQIGDVFVFPSRREGLPNAVLEALAVSLPCVLSDIDPHRELAANNPDAAIRFFPSGDASSLTMALRETFLEVREGRRTDHLPVSHLSPEYRLDVVAQHYLDLYRELVDERP